MVMDMVNDRPQAPINSAIQLQKHCFDIIHWQKKKQAK
jgi:hypothetical protein